MRAVYEDSGSGKLTGRHLRELAAQLPPQAQILSMRVEESQKDGWFWHIKAVMTEVPPRHTQFRRGSVADQVGMGRVTEPVTDHG